VIFWRFLAAKECITTKMDGARLRLPANRNCYRLSRVSWALLKLLVLLLIIMAYATKRFSAIGTAIARISHGITYAHVRRHLVSN